MYRLVNVDFYKKQLIRNFEADICQDYYYLSENKLHSVLETKCVTKTNIRLISGNFSLVPLVLMLVWRTINGGKENMRGIYMQGR